MSRFPFGRPAARRPPRRPDGPAELFVLGVYPSALHVRWVLPDGSDTVGALAVDDEPVVFWDGAGTDTLIADWQNNVEWRPEWGTVGAAGGNGSSGRRVHQHVLTPLGVEPERAYFTDCLPAYFVKTGPGSQGERIRAVYDTSAATTGGALAPADLPPRPSTRELVARTVNEERGTLLAQLAEAGAPAIVTLGQEAADVFAALTDTPPLVLNTGPAYGHPATVRADGRQLEWIALTHPGNRTPAWADRHRRWVQNQLTTATPGTTSGTEPDPASELR